MKHRGHQRLVPVQGGQHVLDGANRVIGSLGVAPHPEQVLGSPAGNDAAPGHLVVPGPAIEQRVGVDLAAGDHPRVRAAAAELHRHVLLPLADSCQPARQCVPPAVGVGDRVGPDHRNARSQGVHAPSWSLREGQVGLHRVELRIRIDPFADLGQVDRQALGVRSRRGDRPRIAGAYQRALQVGQRIPSGRRFAAPPRVARRQHQVGSQQVARDGRKKPVHRMRFQERGPDRVGHQHLTGPHRLQQPRHAQRGVGPKLQRIAPRVVQPAQHAVHALQSVQRTQIQALVAHRQVVALDQWNSQVASQIGLLEVGLVVGARSQQHGARRLVRLARRQPVQCLEQAPEARCQPLHVHRSEAVGEQSRHQDPVLQRIP